MPNLFSFMGDKSKSRNVLIARPLFIALLLYFFALNTACLVHAITWINKPFPGFLFYDFPGVGSFGDYQWPGFQAGVHYRDVILMVNGRRVYSGKDIQNILNTTPIGTKLQYLFVSNGEKVIRNIPVSLFTFADFLKIFMIPYVGGVTFGVLGLIVYILKRDTPASWTFLLFCLSLGTYFVTGFELQSAASSFWGYYVNIFGLSLFPAACIHLSLVFPEKTSLIQRRPWLPLALYGISSALFVFHIRAFVALTGSTIEVERTLSISADMLSAVHVNRIYAILAAVAIFVSSVHAYRNSVSVIAKQRARVVLLGCGAAFIPATIAMSLVSINKVVIPFNLFTLPGIIFPTSIGYAIARHNLFDVDVYIKRTVGYVLMTGVVAVTYFLVQTVVSRLVLQPAFGAQAESVYPIVFALLIVFFFNPINRRVQGAVERLFFRKAYDYKATVASIGDAVTSLVSLDAILTKVISIIQTQLFLDRVGVVVLDSGQQACRFVFFGDPIASALHPTGQSAPPYDDPLLSLLREEKRLITKYDIDEDPELASVRESCSRSFQDLGASVAVPLLYQDTFAGMLTVGYKKSGHFYSRDDIDLLKTASTIAATAIEQAREKEQRGTLMRLFSKHVSPEVAEALWRQREQFLDGGRPRSQKQIVTVMFTDLQGFTSVSEQFDPQVLMDWLNTYMDAIARTVMDHGGVVDDYFGDGVKVNFGVPVPRTTDAEVSQDAVSAVTCALSLEQEMKRLNSAMEDRGLPTLRMRVGINTGPAVAGSLGSAERMKYTTLGDTVNTAARLESFSKDLDLSPVADSPCRILISESTLRHLGEKFQVQSVGELSLKGKTEKICAYCVFGHVSRESMVS